MTWLPDDKNQSINITDTNSSRKYGKFQLHFPYENQNEPGWPYFSTQLSLGIKNR